MEETKKVKSKSVKERIIVITNELSLQRAGKNDFQGFKYFKPDDILRNINPLLEKNNLITMFNMEYIKEAEMYRGVLIIEDLFSEEKVIYHFDIPLTQVKGAGQAQNAGATMTYCKRYMIMNAFNIADNEVDPDNVKNKPVVAKSENAVIDISKTIEAIRKIKDKEKLNDWKKKASVSKIYTEAQKNLIIRAIEEQLQ